MTPTTAKPSSDMRTRRRYNIAGHAHELTFSCHRRWPLLNKDRTRRWFIESLDRARQRWHFDLWAFVIMPEHAHVLLYPRTSVYDTGEILKAIKQSVSRRAVAHLRVVAPRWLENLKVVRPSGRIEHRFWMQGGGYDRNIDNSKTAWKVVDYIHMNPVRRGLVERAVDWPWSSARWYQERSDALLGMDGCPPDAPA